MKSHSLLTAALIVSVSATHLVLAATDTEALFSRPAQTAWRAAHRTNMLTRWEAFIVQTNLVTQKVSVRTNTFVELGAGLNVPNRLGEFVPANPNFEITRDGAEARGTLHNISVPADIYSGAGIVVVQPEGQRLTFQPLSINYYNPVDGSSLLLAAITNEELRDGWWPQMKSSGAIALSG